MRWIIVGMASLPSLALAAACQVSSDEQQTPVIELFTSEGCSSCPPADRWLADKVARSPKVIGLSFHVDYWNYLGWSDPFSQAQFSDRQRQYRRDGITRGVYTPQVLVSGRELPNWHQVNAWSQAQRLASQSASAVLMLNAGDQATVSLRWLQVPQAATIRVAWLTPEAQSLVPAGENAGRTLTHANVVRAWSAPISVSALAREQRWRITPPAAAAQVGTQGQWVALLERAADHQIIQAVQGAWQACR